MGAQIARGALFAPSSSLLNGTISTIEERLVVSLLSTRLMEALLCLLATLALALMTKVPYEGILLQDPEFLITIAIILKESRRTAGYLRGMGAASLNTIRNSIPSSHYWTATNSLEGNNSFGIDTEPLLPEPKIDFQETGSV
jgi:hypothetical protein